MLTLPVRGIITVAAFVRWRTKGDDSGSYSELGRDSKGGEVELPLEIDGGHDIRHFKTVRL